MFFDQLLVMTFGPKVLVYVHLKAVPWIQGGPRRNAFHHQLISPVTCLASHWVGEWLLFYRIFHGFSHQLWLFPGKHTIQHLDETVKLTTDWTLGLFPQIWDNKRSLMIFKRPSLFHKPILGHNESSSTVLLTAAFRPKSTSSALLRSLANETLLPTS